MGKSTLHWLKMAPLLYPLVYAARGHQNGLRPVPALTCTVENSSLESHRGLCEKEKYFWHALRDCRGYSSLPPRAECEGGEAGKMSQEGFNEEGGSIEKTWKHEERLFGANATERKSEQEFAVGAADVDWVKLTDRELQVQCRVETLRSSGPGGQHRNKTESAVRLLHLPTGLVAFVLVSNMLLILFLHCYAFKLRNHIHCCDPFTKLVVNVLN